jgi:hypothetical protein
MKQFNQVLCTIAFAITIFSCVSCGDSEPPQSPVLPVVTIPVNNHGSDSTKRVRALVVIQSSSSFDYFVIDSAIHIIEVDTAHRVGDIVSVVNGTKDYRIIE